MPDTGPHVQLAAFCEKALQEKDGVLSLIRVIDRLMIRAAGGDAPAELPAALVQTTLVIALRSDQARGRHSLLILGEQPDGTRLPTASIDVIFEGEDRGVNLILPMTLQAQEGLYWFEVRLGDQYLTRVPLRITYQRMPGVG